MLFCCFYEGRRGTFVALPFLVYFSILNEINYDLYCLQKYNDSNIPENKPISPRSQAVEFIIDMRSQRRIIVRSLFGVKIDCPCA